MTDVKCVCGKEVNIEHDVYVRRGKAYCKECALKVGYGLSEVEILKAKVRVLEKEVEILRKKLREYDPYPEEQVCVELGKKLDTADLDVAKWTHSGFGAGYSDL